MKVKSLESGRVEILEIMDSNGFDYAKDCIGNAGGLCSDIVTCEETGDYVTKNDETLEFWLAFCAREEASGKGLEIVRKIGLDAGNQADLNIVGEDIENNQKYFLMQIRDALEDGELLAKLEITQEDAEDAHIEIFELLNRDCFK